MDDRASASDPLSLMTYEELLVFEAALHTQFHGAYAQVLHAIGTTGWVSRVLYDRLEQIQVQHGAVVHALQLDLLEQEINLGHPRT